jgi:hypothetical protein
MLAARPQPQFTVQALEVAQAHRFREHAVLDDGVLAVQHAGQLCS